MPHQNFLNLFEEYFDNFSRDKSINNSLAFGICYRGRNSQYLQIEDSSTANLRKDSPIIYELNSQEDSLHDLSFISSLNNKLKKTFEIGATEDYNFKIGLMTIPFYQFNKLEESENDLPNLLYVFAGMTKRFYEQSQNKIKEKKRMDNLGASIMLWNLKNEKNPLEIIFNYYIEEFPNELFRVVKGKDLDKFFSDYSLENL